MSQPHTGGGYTVIETDNFVADWTRGCAEGWINPMADPVALATIKEVLANSPWKPPATVGWANNIRAIYFPRSVREPAGRLRIRYEVVEDDREVQILDVSFLA